MALCDLGMTPGARALGNRIDSIAWGVFLVWVGVALLAKVGWGLGLVGVGVITLGAQGCRKLLGVKVERFSAVLGAALVVSGAWSILELRIDVVPLLFIAAGVFVLASTWRTRRAGDDRPAHGAPP